MKFVSLVLIVLFSLAGTAVSDEVRFKTAKSGCYQYAITKDDVLIIRVGKDLFLDKETTFKAANNLRVWFTSGAVSTGKVCNDIGKSVYGQIMKNKAVSKINVSNRQVAVFRYPFPTRWGDPEKKTSLSASVLSVVDKVMCGK